jgi:hypothetical protein
MKKKMQHELKISFHTNIKTQEVPKFSKSLYLNCFLWFKYSNFNIIHIVVLPQKKKGELGKRIMGGMNQTMVQYMHIWKCHNETLCTTTKKTEMGLSQSPAIISLVFCTRWPSSLQCSIYLLAAYQTPTYGLLSSVSIAWMSRVHTWEAWLGWEVGSSNQWFK